MNTPEDATFIQWRSGVATGIVLGLAAILFWSATAKAASPAFAERFVQAVMPSLDAPYAVRGIVLVEWALAVVLLSGLRTRMVLGILIAGLAFMNVMLLQARLNGFTGGCGCFGDAGTLPAAMVRNGVLIAVCDVDHTGAKQCVHFCYGVETPIIGRRCEFACCGWVTCSPLIVHWRDCCKSDEACNIRFDQYGNPVDAKCVKVAQD